LFFITSVIGLVAGLFPFEVGPRKISVGSGPSGFWEKAGEFAAAAAVVVSDVLTKGDAS